MNLGRGCDRSASGQALLEGVALIVVLLLCLGGCLHLLNMWRLQQEMRVVVGQLASEVVRKDSDGAELQRWSQNWNRARRKVCPECTGPAAQRFVSWQGVCSSRQRGAEFSGISICRSDEAILVTGSLKEAVEVPFFQGSSRTLSISIPNQNLNE